MFKKIYYSILFVSLFSFSQDKEFVVKKKLEDAISLIEKYQNSLSKEEINPEKSADKYIYKLILNDEIYDDAKDEDHYLILKKGKSKKAKVSASLWDITLTRKGKFSTAVNVELNDIEVDKKYDYVDLDKSVSSGKLEEELGEYFKNNTTLEELSAKEVKIPSKEEEDNLKKLEAEVEKLEAEKKALNEKATKGKEIKDKKVAQKTSKPLENFIDLGFMLNKNKLISLPNDVDEISDKLGTSPKEHKSVLCYDHKYRTWEYKKDFVFTYTELKNNTDFYSLQYYGAEKVKGLPYSLVFNKSNLKDLRKQFAINKPKVAFENEISQDDTGVKVNVMSFKMKNRSVKLYFNDKDLLNGISESITF